MPLRLLTLLALLFFALSGRLAAHDAGLSQADVRLTADALEITLAYDPHDVRRMLPPGSMPGTDSSDHTLVNARAELERLATLLVEVRDGAHPLAPLDTVVEFTPADHIGFRFRYPRPESDALAFRFPNLASLPAAHREYFTFTDEHGVASTVKMLSARDNEAAVSLAAPPLPVPAGASAEPTAVPPASAPAEPSAPGAAQGPVTGFRAFLLLGIEHIWTGYDHLLFLFGLLLVCSSFRSIAAIVTCFTVAHSVTLGLAAFDVLSLSPALVEPLIAASIVFVGVENLVRRGEAPRGRPALAFAFGLIHGFGFAGVLRELGIGAGGHGFALPLFAFNLGVELGQLALAALVLPFVWRLRKNPVFLRRGVPILSALVATAGLWWLVERTLLPG